MGVLYVYAKPGKAHSRIKNTSTGQTVHLGDIYIWTLGIILN